MTLRTSSPHCHRRRARRRCSPAASRSPPRRIREQCRLERVGRRAGVRRVGGRNPATGRLSGLLARPIRLRPYRRPYSPVVSRRYAPVVLCRAGRLSVRVRAAARSMSRRVPVVRSRRWRAYYDYAALAVTAIADPVDRAGVVVRHEQRAVRRDQHVGRPAPRALALQPAFGERLVARSRLPLVERHQRDAIADLLAAVPRAVLGDEDLVAVARRETACRCRSACRAPRRAARASAPAARTRCTGACVRTRDRGSCRRDNTESRNRRPGVRRVVQRRRAARRRPACRGRCR